MELQAKRGSEEAKVTWQAAADDLNLNRLLQRPQTLWELLADELRMFSLDLVKIVFSYLVYCHRGRQAKTAADNRIR